MMGIETGSYEISLVPAMVVEVILRRGRNLRLSCQMLQVAQVGEISMTRQKGAHITLYEASYTDLCDG